MCVPGSTAWFVQEKSKLNDEHLMFPYTSYQSWYLFLARLGKAELISLKCFSVRWKCLAFPAKPSARSSGHIRTRWTRVKSSKEHTLKLIRAGERRERLSPCCTLPLNLTFVITGLTLIWHTSEGKPLATKPNKAGATGISCTMARITERPRLEILHRIRKEKGNIHNQPWLYQGGRRKSWGL